MGWLFCAESKKELVERLVRPEVDDTRRIEVIAHTLVGSQLWMVVEYTALVRVETWFKGRSAEPGDTWRIISVALLRKERGHAEENSWGYKDLSEAEGPYYYSCPLKFLELAPEACPDWRAKVREWHEEKRKVPAWKSWTPGDELEVYGKRYIVTGARYSLGRRSRWIGWNVYRKSDQHRFMLSGGALKDAVLVNEGESP